MQRLAISALILALAAAACAEPIGEGGPLTTRPAGGGGETTSTTAATPTTAPAVTSTTASATTSTSVAPTTSAATATTAAAETMGLKVYFLLEGGGTNYRPGPFLVPVYREVPRTLQVATAAMRELIAGPTEAERSAVPALSSALPADTMLLGIAIDEGLATIDLSREFEAGGGTLSMAARLAQVVFTLTQFPTVRLVEFHLDGEPVSVFSSEGIILDHPVGREDYRDLTPLIMVDDPAYGAPGSCPLRVRGVAAVFEAVLNWVLADGDGWVVAEGSALADNGMGWGSFEFTIPCQVEEKEFASLIVLNYSAEDGSPENVREHPIWLTP